MVYVVSLLGVFSRDSRRRVFGGFWNEWMRAKECGIRGARRVMESLEK